MKLLVFCIVVTPAFAAPPPDPHADPNADVHALPLVADGFAITEWAREPLVRNACAVAFDRRGRMFVGMGPQYRNPTPETPGDSVFILEDKDGDGVAETSRFATGFNCVQSLAWHGRDLWVANAPDLTIVRDLDGDDVADEYVRVFTDLGNLEHSIEALHWAPDGRLYMGKGNSKGLNLPGRVAPKPFRELAGVSGPAGAPDFPPPQTFSAKDYRHTFQDPKDDWGREGGVLRCDDLGANLEIVARGLRNPWDMAFDDAFDWLGSDQDQNEGDRFFMPFVGAHFGWGHPWSADWTGRNHLPTAPISGPVYVGSGTGIVWSDVPGWPASHRGCFLANDWLLKKTYVYRPRWDGALLLPQGDPFAAPLIVGGNAVFRPTDLEFGPDGALYILGWGRPYGLILENGQPANEGRIYRVTPRGFAPLQKADAPKRGRALEKWTFGELAEDLASWMPTWRTDAADELVRRGAAGELRALLAQENLPRGQRTWALWTLGRIAPEDALGDAFFAEEKTDRLNALRILGFRAARGHRAPAPALIAGMRDAEARVRLAAVLAMREARAAGAAPSVAGLLEKETDRIVFYAAWQTLRTLAAAEELRPLLADPHVGVRRGALLALLESRAVTAEEVAPFAKDADAETAKVATLFLAKTGFVSAPAVTAKDDGWPLRIGPASVKTASGKPVVVAALSAGAKAYADRRYQITRVPESLLGATFVQTPNDDAGSRGDAALSFDLSQPATVFLAHDTRIPTPPIWMAVNQPQGWADSDLTLTTSDGTFRIWQKDFPAGRVALGGNTDDGSEHGHSAYLVALRAAPFSASGKMTAAPDVLALLPKADATRGAWLFAGENGAGCWRCHAVNQRGGAFGPNLTGIGERGDAAALIRSILDPNAEITQGFALLSLTMRDGKAHAGVLVEETDLALTLAQADGPRLVLPKAEIAKRESLDVSPMPPFAALLSAPQCADLVAFLLAQKSAVK